MAGPVVVKLEKPLKFGDEEITELTLREPVAKDFRVITTPDRVFALSLDLAAQLADLPPAVLDRMGVEDTMAVVGAVTGFLPQSLLTGKT